MEGWLAVGGWEKGFSPSPKKKKQQTQGQKVEHGIVSQEDPLLRGEQEAQGLELQEQLEAT